ncbi:MAG: hypothetical protein EA401_14895 [Planctomycetota bacterium]|nr:MAG: hypothetical protein EA401_14895 [Planctomycetota bacterium]
MPPSRGHAFSVKSILFRAFSCPIWRSAVLGASLESPCKACIPCDWRQANSQGVGMSWAIEDVDGMAMLRLAAPWGSALIACQGGQVWQAHVGGRDRLYTSPQSPWQAGLPLRGGIPLCWPWLGLHPQHPEWGMHGPLRLQPFTLLHVHQQGQDIRARMSCELSPELPGVMSPCTAVLHCAFTPCSLTIVLSIHNRGTHCQPSAGAMHTYLACDATSFSVAGLEGCAWHGPDDSDLQGRVHHNIDHCPGSTRTIYDAAPRPYPLRCGDGSMRAHLQRWGSRSVVIWNPGPEHDISDLCDDAWLDFVCVETANSGGDARSIPPGGVGCMASRWRWLDAAENMPSMR